MKMPRVLILIMFLLAIPCLAFAARPGPVMDQELLAKAEPDECYYGIGLNSPAPIPGGGCGAGIPKVNEAYVWGMTKSGNTVWFGTAPNVHCLVEGGYLGLTSPQETSSWVCEFGSSWYAVNIPLPAQVGDWRPPKIYSYDLDTDTLTPRTPPLDPAIYSVSGIRSAGSIDDIVILGGPNFSGGITLFAFQASTGSYLGSHALPEYDNIRKWRVVGGWLYTTVGYDGGGGVGGYVLKWTGDLSAPPGSIWSFEEVGALDGSGAEIAAYGSDRIAVSTWPGPGRAGIFISPQVPEVGGLTNSTGPWTKVWEIGEYEPDPVVAYTIGGGALAFFDGYLYWGTMHVPLLATEAACSYYFLDCGDSDILTETAQATNRAIAIFRGRNLEAATEGQREKQLLYGERELPAYDTGSGSWVDTSTGMGRPKYGSSGFGNSFNNYTWTMEVAAGNLFVGTMDWSYLYDTMLPGANPFPFLPPLINSILRGYGADLWRFSSSKKRAESESTNGLGNYLNYGIRTMIAIDENTLCVGTSNPMNLETQGAYQGGWELIELTNASGD